MIILDTNVLSALMQNAPDQTVVHWLDRIEAAEIWTTAITVFEIRYGLERRPKGHETARLEAAFEALIADDLAGRVALVDRRAADAAGVLAARREAAGRPVDVRDTLIAGIALAQRATLATRNLRHFADLEVPVVNPWG